MPIIIDTDINEEKGADSDDAFAIVYAARMLDVAAITISPCENAQKRAEFVRQLLVLSERGYIPVYYKNMNQLVIWQPCTICALGPMTNVMRLVDNSGKEMIHRIVITASLYGIVADGHNVRCDRESMDAVMRSDVPLDFVGKNVREQTRLTRADCDELESTGTELGSILANLHRNWLDCWNADDSGMHDQLTVASHLIADYVEWEDVTPNRRVLKSVDSAAFKHHFMRVIFDACYGR